MELTQNGLHGRSVTTALHSFSLTACGLVITVLSECEDTLRNINKYLLPWLPRHGSRPASEDLLFAVTNSASTGCFQLVLNGSGVHDDAPEQQVFSTLQRIVDAAIIRRVNGRAFIHAAVVVYRGAGVLLSGSSRSGKTTLAAELIARGAQYASDEFAVVDEQGIVYPWPRPLMVRRPNAGPHPVLASELGAQVRRTPVRASWIFFLRHTNTAAVHVRSLSRAETVMRLLQNTPNVLQENPGILRNFLSVCRDGNGFEGVRGEAPNAAEQLLRFITSGDSSDLQRTRSI